MYCLRYFLLLFALLIPTQTLAEAFNLEQAYKNELEILRQEKVQLEARLKELRNEASAQEALKRDIGAMSAELMTLELDNKSTKRILQDTSNKQSSNPQEILAHIYKQSLKLIGLDAETNTEQISPIKVLESLTQATTQIRQDGRLRKTKAHPYFDTKGLERKGEAILIAKVGAIGTEGTSVYPLLPVANLGLKQSPHTVPLKSPGNEVQTWPTHLFQGQHAIKGVVERSSTLAEKFSKGGWLMWPILVLAFLSLAVALERMVFLIKVTLKDKGFSKQVEKDILNGKLETLDARCKDSQHPLAPILSEMLDSRNAPKEELEDMACQQLLRYRPNYTRFLSVLQVTALAAPLLGLLGTVTGMIGSFAAIQEFSLANPQLFSAGISEALLTTQFGLGLAIPAMLLHSLFTRMSERQLGRFQYLSLLLLNFISAEKTFKGESKKEKNLSIVESA